MARDTEHSFTLLLCTFFENCLLYTVAHILIESYFKKRSILFISLYILDNSFLSKK